MLDESRTPPCASCELGDGSACESGTTWGCIPPGETVKPGGGNRRRYTHHEWLKEAQRRFGANAGNWRYVCPACGLTQTARDFVAAGMTKEDASRRVAQYCIGNFTDHDCDWKAFGLFRGPVIVEVDGDGIAVFDFAGT